LFTFYASFDVFSLINNCPSMLQTPASFVPLMSPQAHPDPLTFVFHRDRLLMRTDDLNLPTQAEVVAMAIKASHIHPLGLWRGRYCQVAWVEDEAVPGPQYSWQGLRPLFTLVDEELMALAGRASQIAEWARTHRFCGACGTPMQLADGERCMVCPNCNMQAYPRISPAMMVLIRKGDSVLLAKHTRATANRFIPLAGFLEAGESLEEAVHREVMEEVGLRVHKLEYFLSQSWPFPHSLMIAFTAEYLDGEIRVDGVEISEARWFGPADEWPERVATVSVSSLLVDAHRPRQY
jgi:NAD+ diphosphatase